MAFDDVDTDDGSGEAVVTLDSDFADGVRTTLPDTDSLSDEKLYEDPDGTGQADDVDPRGLFRKPTVNVLRYHARENPYGRPIVRKPVADAFKHGFDVEGGGDDDAKPVDEFLSEYRNFFELAVTFARRDGLVVIMHQVADPQSSAAAPIPRDGTAQFDDLTLWTLDNLSDDISESEAADHVDYDDDQLYVTEGDEHGGVVVVSDISSPDHGDVVGYGIQPREESENTQTATFVHADRCHHLTWDRHVDGDLGNELTGRQVGESILTPILQPLEASQMGFWAIKNILFRYSAPLHAVEPPESWGTDEYEEFTEMLENLSMRSDATLPPGAQLEVAEGVTDFDPEPYYETLVKAMCASSEFTLSVLQGTQTGTVSGSETDIKGYFNAVHVLRSQYIADFMRNVVEKVATYDQATVPRAAAFADWTLGWGPLFKPTDVEQAEGAVSLVTAVTNGIKNYVLTPDEARSVLNEEWAEFNIDVDLDDLTEDEMDTFDRINVREVGRGPKDDEPVSDQPRQNPTRQNGGGQPEGQTRESSQPQRNTADSLSEDEIEQIADEVAERLQ